ncbi:MAG: response regulator [Candidatus Wallbacteria bacterium]|nr:response regulator [Candidatus Wallbacteria bacterium]
MAVPHKVLVADDDFLAVVMLRDMLESQGYEIVEALNGRETLEQAERKLPDLILLDIMMPLVDGKEVCRRLKRNPVTQNIPIIMLTALSSSTDIKECFDAGASDYLIKPVEKDRLLKKIDNAIRKQAFRVNIEKRSLETGEEAPPDRDQRSDRRAKLRGGVAQYLGQIEQSVGTLKAYLARLESEGDTDPDIKDVANRLDAVTSLCLEIQQALAKPGR